MDQGAVLRRGGGGLSRGYPTERIQKLVTQSAGFKKYQTLCLPLQLPLPCLQTDACMGFLTDWVVVLPLWQETFVSLEREGTLASWVAEVRWQLGGDCRIAPQRWGVRRWSRCGGGRLGPDTAQMRVRVVRVWKPTPVKAQVSIPAPGGGSLAGQFSGQDPDCSGLTVSQAGGREEISGPATAAPRLALTKV